MNFKKSLSLTFTISLFTLSFFSLSSHANPCENLFGRGRTGINIADENLGRRDPILATREREEAKKLHAVSPYGFRIVSLGQGIRKIYLSDGTVKERQGGNGGHAVMFLDGVEIDPVATQKAGIPQLRVLNPLHEAKKILDPDSGVMVSINAAFLNANWVAVPGMEAGEWGGLKPGEVLTRERFDSLITESVQGGWFHGIKPKRDIIQEYIDNHSLNLSIDEVMNREEHYDLRARILAERGFGTDWGVRTSRTIYGVRLPSNIESMGTIVASLNEANVRSSQRGNPWDLMLDNCALTAWNALAATGMVAAKDSWSNPLPTEPQKLSTFKLYLFSLIQLAFGRMPDASIPSIVLMRAANEAFALDMENVEGVLKNRHAADLFSTYGTLAAEPGAFLVHRRMMENMMFREGKDPFTFPWWRKEFKAYWGKDAPKELLGFEASLDYWMRRFESAESNFISNSEMPGDFKDLPFNQRYQEWVRLQRERIRDWQQIFEEGREIAPGLFINLYFKYQHPKEAESTTP